MERALPFALAAVLTTALIVVITPLDLVPAWLIGAGVVTFAAYGWDKRRAQAGGQRIPEIVLHALALGGGVIGGWAGREIFRHKTRKPIFFAVLVAATALWVVIVLVAT